jgi:predicted GNAT superfamily acetyltransferase
MGKNFMNDIVIRNAEPADDRFILRINEENVEVLSPMDQAKLDFYKRIADILWVIDVDGERAAFLIGIREGADYPNENFVFFSRMFPKFLYVDRIVIDEPFRKMGLGTKIYEAVKEHALADGVTTVTAEVDTEPVYNNASLIFHDGMGFREVGEQWVRGNSMKVSLVAWKLV